MSAPSEPRNPFYLLLLLVSLLFVMTALGYAIVPVLEEKAIAAGRVVPESEFRDALRTDGWKWLLYQLAAMFVFGILSMVLDRLRSLKKAAAENTISPDLLPSSAVLRERGAGGEGADPAEEQNPSPPAPLP